MKIIKVEVFAIRLPLNEPFVIAYDHYEDMPTIVTKVVTDNGLVGWGEAVPDQHVTGETWESTFQVIQHELSPLIINESPFSIDLIHKKMNEKIFGAPSAKAAIDIALYDLMGKESRQPIYQLIGGKSHSRLNVPRVISMKTPGEMADDANVAVEAGCENIKIKVGSDPFEDIKRIKAVREAISDSVRLRVDANQGWSRTDALIVIENTKDCLVEWYEQPVEAGDLLSLQEIRAASKVKIMVDEGVHNSHDLLKVIQIRAADLLNIKIMKSGGIYPALALANIAEAAGMPCQVGSMVESAIATMAGAHLSISRSIIQSNEMVGPLMFSKDIGSTRYANYVLEVEETAGLGVEVDESLIKEFTNNYCLIENV
ncbi:mandelate racemase/muconate lactonizing enzyme family protein [Pseudalkalibacillus decolorationis]|uniref:mandelate racemase/muconate lactonizing enzyme family protein n=1 Tax=Pseudalkalibacillus decolorationis TaxID=163879 RepID=UPI002148A0DA|nr:dipeptide epimerase [Pseudalkalibacillus decolorationis]